MDMHTLAERVILGGLLKGGFLRGDLEEMMSSNLGAVFMPHGLGHLLGIDTHDVGGYGYDFPPRPERDGANKLRTARVLEEGMVMTVEPGCYFNRYVLCRFHIYPTIPHPHPTHLPFSLSLSFGE